MVLKGARADSFAAAPDPNIRAVLVYGPDAGLVAERVAALGRAVAGDLADPFRVSTIGAATLAQDPARLQDEAQALSMMGGRRVVIVRGATDASAPLFESLFALAAVEGLVVVEAGELGPRSTLRQLFEAAQSGAAMACYLDDADGLENVIRGALSGTGLAIEDAALGELVDRLGSDRLLTRRALEKLILYKGRDTGPITPAEVAACIEDSAEVAVDDVVYAAASGEAERLNMALQRAAVEDLSPVRLLRVAAMHIQNLQRAVGHLERGGDIGGALKALRPPVFGKRQDAFRTQIRNWDGRRLASALAVLTEAEARCKTTGMPDRLVCERALFGIAAAARTRRGRSISS